MRVSRVDCAYLVAKGRRRAAYTAAMSRRQVGGCAIVFLQLFIPHARPASQGYSNSGHACQESSVIQEWDQRKSVAGKSGVTSSPEARQHLLLP